MLPRVSASRNALLCVLATQLVAWLQPACATTCDRTPDEAPHLYTGGTTRGDVYESAPPDGPFLYFPAGRTYRLVHGLGVVPTGYQSYLAFDEQPGSFVESAGNQMTFEEWTATHVDVRNDTCSDVRVRVVLWARPPGAEPDAGSVP
jgi:hypothetical protein